MTIEAACPFCGETFAVTAAWEPGAGGWVEFVEDCQVCCRPATIRVLIEEGEVVEAGAFAA